jgi:hypothetical protein
VAVSVDAAKKVAAAAGSKRLTEVWVELTSHSFTSQHP